MDIQDKYGWHFSFSVIFMGRLPLVDPFECVVYRLCLESTLLSEKTVSAL